MNALLRSGTSTGWSVPTPSWNQTKCSPARIVCRGQDLGIILSCYYWIFSQELWTIWHLHPWHCSSTSPWVLTRWNPSSGPWRQQSLSALDSSTTPQPMVFHFPTFESRGPNIKGIICSWTNTTFCASLAFPTSAVRHLSRLTTNGRHLSFLSPAAPGRKSTKSRGLFLSLRHSEKTEAGQSRLHLFYRLTLSICITTKATPSGASYKLQGFVIRRNQRDAGKIHLCEKYKKLASSRLPG
jgi:hypothetical protein